MIPDAPPRDRRSLGAVYTPEALAAWVAAELAGCLPTPGGLIVDPACGDGALLAAVAELLPGASLLGLDLDPAAIDEAGARLPASARLVHADALALAGGWAGPGPLGAIAGIIANPPWGAALAQAPTELRAMGYALAAGQFDSYDLFVEACLANAAEGTALALVIPDSLFASEHAATRKLLLARTRLVLLARLGEGFFPGVYRGTAVVVAVVGRPAPDHAVACLRLDRAWRRRILAGGATFAEARAALAHAVPQARFEQDEAAGFAIDVRDRDEGPLARLGAAGGAWAVDLVSGRGVELSKHGKVVACPACGACLPAPRAPKALTCGACGAAFASAAATAEVIVAPLDHAAPGWHPLIAGEDVDRYRCAPSRRLKLGVPGIRYKAPDAAGCRKLLVRKTGVGLKAAIDEAGALTTQVVFHYHAAPGADVPPWYLDYLQGVLASRTLLAYHLKRLGENEWRSHPYVTQEILGRLPIPDLRASGQARRQGEAIARAAAARRAAAAHDGPEDLAVEGLVAGLYGLDGADVAWALDVLEQAQALEPIRTLRLADPAAVRPLRVD